MIFNIDPGKARKSVNFIDNIVYSHVKDLDGRPLDLTLALMTQNGNVERRLAMGEDIEEIPRLPLLVWFNGVGWRATEDLKTMMAAELEYLAEAGYIVALIHYRSSSQGKFPSQLIDCKTAVRFLRANADKYAINPERVGVIGRSAGGMLAAWMAMNTDGFDLGEWSDQSSKIQAAVDMFGLKDIKDFLRKDMIKIKQPGYRWKTISDTHEGLLLNLKSDMSVEEMENRASAASPISAVNSNMCPLTILHGTADTVVPVESSIAYYEALCKAGLENRVNLYLVKNAGHGTPGFFQPMTQKIIIDFFDRYLKR